MIGSLLPDSGPAKMSCHGSPPVHCRVRHDSPQRRNTIFAKRTAIQHPPVRKGNLGSAMSFGGISFIAGIDEWIGFAATVLGSAGVLALLMILGRWGERDRRRLVGLCIDCGYDLRGNVSGTCPECGARVMRTE